MKRKGFFRIVFVVIVCFLLLVTISILIINICVKNSVRTNIITQSEAAELNDIDCILVLGCLVKSDGKPSDMLADRLKCGIALYESDCAPKIIMSGDHGTLEYDEVNTMKRVAVNSGVPSSDIFMDHAGFSTYESLYRAKAVFGVDKMIIVTQEYHLYRALYIADKLGIEAYGVSADYHTYSGQIKRDFREIFARCKDFVTATIKPNPKYLGEMIPISGNGDLTNDKK